MLNILLAHYKRHFITEIMSKFLTFFNIGSMSGDNAYLGLAPDSAEGKVISTLDQNIVLRVELSNQKQIQSWTSEHKLSHKVVYDFKSAKYVGVSDNQKLGTWEEETTKIEKFRVKLSRQLEDIVSFDNKHTILVYKDGTCESLESRLNASTLKCKSIVTSPHVYRISQIACFNTMDNRVMLTYFVSSRKSRNSKLELVYFLLNDDDLTPNRSADNVAKVKRIEITKDESTLSGYTVVDGDQFPSVITIGSDKRIYMLPLNCAENAPTEFGAHSATFNYLRTDKPLTVINVGANCIAIYGGNAKKDGASLILYNTVHFTVVCVQEFKVHLSNCRLWAIGKHILMADGQRLLCAPFRIAQGKLSEAIGSKRSIEWDRPVNKDCVNEEDFLEEVTSFDDKPRNNCRQYKPPMSLIPPYATESFAIFEENLETLYHYDVPIEFAQDGSVHDTKLRSSVHPRDELYDCELNRILSDVLESNGASEIEITEHQIPILIKANQPDELVRCLRKYTNVSERMLVKCLKYFLSLSDSPNKLTYINQVFACSFDYDSIENHLRTDLNLEDAIYLMDILLHRNFADEEVSLEEAPQYGHNFDSDMALINWFVVLLDTHHLQFLLSSDVTVCDYILKWKELMEEFVEDTQSLKQIRGALVNLVNGKFKQNDNANSKWYSVERVKLY